MRRDIVWEVLDRPGLEHLSLTVAPDGITADGLVIVDLGAGALRLRYVVRCDPEWRFRDSELSLDRDGQRSSLLLARDPSGTWEVNGQARPDLDGCTDIDIMVTPFTNTLPIRNLRLRPEETKAIRVAYVKLPDLSVSPANQEYTRLDPADPPRRFRYHGLFRNFVADLAVDADGIVIDYPPAWRRRAG